MQALLRPERDTVSQSGPLNFSFPSAEPRFGFTAFKIYNGTIKAKKLG